MSMLDYFDELVTLAKDNPAQFEVRKKEILEDYFNTLSAEKQQIARGRQWRLDQELNKHKNGIDRYNAMVVEFWAGFKEFQDALNGNKTLPTTDAKVIEFKHK